MPKPIWLVSASRPWHQIQNGCPVCPGWDADSSTKVQCHGSSKAVADETLDGLSGCQKIVVGFGGFAVALGAPGVVQGDFRKVVNPILCCVAAGNIEVARFRVIGRRPVGIGPLEPFLVSLERRIQQAFFLDLYGSKGAPPSTLNDTSPGCTAEVNSLFFAWVYRP